MALAIDISSPAVAIGNPGPTVTTTSFTPPSGALLLVGWAGDSVHAALPSAPTITDSLGTPLTYTLIGWRSLADGGADDGQSAMWWAVVGTSAPITVSVTNNDATNRTGAVKVQVITGQHATPIGASGKNGSASAASIAQPYTAQADGGWGFLADCDWYSAGVQTAGAGCTVDGSAAAGFITYGFARRTAADDVNAAVNTLSVTLPATSTSLSWVYAEILPAAAAGPGPVAGPYTGPAPGRISPTGQWRIPPAIDDAVAATSVAAEAVTVTAAAQDAAVGVAVNAECATASVTVDNPTVSTATATNAPAEAVAVAAGAQDASVALAPNAESASATVVAADPTPALAVNAECATASVVVDNATISTATAVSVAAECATATVAAQNTSTAIAAASEAATATAAAADPIAAIGAPAESVAVSSTAFNPTITTVNNVFANAECATATVGVGDAAAAIAVLAEAATIVAEAWLALVQGPVFNATSAATVTGTSSTATVSAGRTSTATVAAPATSATTSSGRTSADTVAGHALSAPTVTDG